MFYTLARATQIRLRFSEEVSPLLIRFLLLTEGKREFHNTCRYDCDILGKFIKTLTYYGENCSTSNTATGRTYICDIYRYKKLSILTRKYTLTFDLNLCSSSYTACTFNVWTVDYWVSLFKRQQNKIQIAFPFNKCVTSGSGCSFTAAVNGDKSASNRWVSWATPITLYMRFGTFLSVYKMTTCNEENQGIFVNLGFSLFNFSSTPLIVIY